MRESMIINILRIMNSKNRLLLPKAILAPHTDFSDLRNDGYVKIEKIDGYFYASLSEKGKSFLAEYVDTLKTLII